MAATEGRAEGSGETGCSELSITCELGLYAIVKEARVGLTGFRKCGIELPLTRKFAVYSRGGMLASGVYGVVARQIVRNGGFDPDDLSMLDSVFAHSWTLIESQYTFANWEGRNASRERLATIIVALAKKHHLRKRLLVVRAASSFKTTPSS